MALSRKVPMLFAGHGSFPKPLYFQDCLVKLGALSLFFTSGYTGVVNLVKRMLLGTAANVTIETYIFGSQHSRTVRYAEYWNHYQHQHYIGYANKDHNFMKNVAGAMTELGFEAVNLDDWTLYRYKLVASGTSFACYRDNMAVAKFSVVDADLAAGWYGLYTFWAAPPLAADIHPYEIKVNAVDFDGEVTQLKALEWGLFPSHSSASLHLNTMLLASGITDGWLQFDAEGSYIGGSLRFADHADHYWIDSQLPMANHDYRIGKSVLGVETELAFEAINLNNLIEYTYKIQVQGTTLKGYRDGVEKFSVVDAAIPGPGYVAVYNWSNAADEHFRNVSWGAL